MSLFTAIVKSLIKNVGDFASGLVGVPIAGSIVVDAWQYWEKDNEDERQRKAEIEAYARKAVQDVLPEALEAVRSEAPQLSEAERKLLVDYLCQVPGAIHRSLRRPEDRTGTTVPPGLALRKPNDLLPFLPPRLPRYTAGEKPYAHLDLELIELLGQGGFGEVWKARHLDRPKLPPVVLKFCLDANAARSLERERDLLDQIASVGRQHDGIVKLLNTYFRAHPPCVEYEYIEDGELTGLLRAHRREHGGLDAPSAAKIIERLARIVGYTHRLQPAIVHRDLKPANILVRKEAGQYRLKIADFGIGGLAAKQALHELRSGRTILPQRQMDLALGAYTPFYASPEQMDGDAPDPRDDVHALGIIWYQLQTGNLSAIRLPADWREELVESKMPGQFLDLLGMCIGRLERRPADGVELADRLKVLTNEKANYSPPVVSRVDPSGAGDYRTLEEAVANTTAGVKIQLVAGSHRLSEPLSLTKPLTLTGEGMDSTHVVCDGEGYVLKFSADGVFGAIDLAFVHEGSLLANVVEVDQGEIYFVRCRFVGGVPDDTNRFGHGLLLNGDSRGQVRACEMCDNGANGILATGQAQLNLEANICRENEKNGIAYLGSAAGTARKNTCENNQAEGIYVGGKAQPMLEANEIWMNGSCGIGYSDNAAGTAQSNTCWGNGADGISVDQESRPTLAANDCRKNNKCGIAYADNSAGTARNNSCAGNEDKGILVAGSAQPTLQGNTCRLNEDCGIVFRKNARGAARDNKCIGNNRSGIVVRGQAQPILETNSCCKNKEDGITYLDQAGGEGNNNHCLGNHKDGIFVAITANPHLLANHCSGNEGDDDGDCRPVSSHDLRPLM